jgi:hypothetical protein
MLTHPRIFCGDPEQSSNIHFLFVHSCYHLENCVELYVLPAYSQELLFILTWFTKQYCLFGHYSLKVLFIATLFIDIIITIHDIHTIIHELYTIDTIIDFIPMKVREWRPMSKAKYRMEHNHATKYCYYHRQSMQNPCILWQTFLHSHEHLWYHSVSNLVRGGGYISPWGLYILPGALVIRSPGNVKHDRHVGPSSCDNLVLWNQ